MKYHQNPHKSSIEASYKFLLLSTDPSIILTTVCAIDRAFLRLHVEHARRE
jgi:hypothetical protein